ncbi:hypothetical protein [Asticcacaulis sp.]|uniref:hypothetical protein n=1 Tax=Asticcacaulis sp. TaxID=1872648 RepID=UPI003F7BE85F
MKASLVCDNLNRMFGKSGARTHQTKIHFPRQKTACAALNYRRLALFLGVALMNVAVRPRLMRLKQGWAGNVALDEVDLCHLAE